MRGRDQRQDGMFSYVSMEDRIPPEHPLRAIRSMVDPILKSLSPRFSELYADAGRPSIPPERLLRALLLQVLFTIRSERQLMEQLNYNLLYRWFVGLSMDDAVWAPTVFSKNRDRLLGGHVAHAFFEKVLLEARKQGLISAEHFTVDGTLIEAWAGLKSFRRKGEQIEPPDDPGNPTVDFRGETRTNATHVSTTDPDARLYRKSNGTEAKLCYAGHVLMENRHGLVVDTMITKAQGRGERSAAIAMLCQVPGHHEITLGADKAYDTREFVGKIRKIGVVPHVAQNDTNRSSAIDGRTTRHPGYAISQRKRKCVEQIFGWLKTIAMLRKTRHRGTDRVDWMFAFALAVYNLVRMKNLLRVAA